MIYTKLRIVLQESFIAAFKNIRNYRGDASFGSWLKRIVVNNSISVLRKNKAEFEDIDQTSEYDLYEEDNDGWSEMEVPRVMNAIESLPDGFRTVLSLYLLEGYDHREIAEFCTYLNQLRNRSIIEQRKSYEQF